MPKHPARSRRAAPRIVLVAAILLVAGCNRFGARPATQAPDAGPGESPAAVASGLAPSAPLATVRPTRAPLPTFDPDLGSIDAALSGTNDALGAAGNANSEGNLK